MESLSQIVAKVNSTLSAKGKSKVNFAHELNKYLSKPRENTKGRMITVYRWLSGQNSPNAETILAMKQWLEDNTI